MMERTAKGTITTIAAFFLWGILPTYWKALNHVSAVEILAHRIVWSLIFVIVLFLIQGNWKEAKRVISSPDGRIFLVTSFLIGANWLTYIYAVNTNQIVEASLGYFINPLFIVLLGIVFLRERLNVWQTIALLLAFIGVLFMTMQYGRIPWIALVLAFTFGIYGLLRKTAKAESMVGLLCETGVLTPIASVYLLVLGLRGAVAFGSSGLWTNLLMAGTGVVTAGPLLLFAYGARRIQYSTVGFLQYISPTGMLLVGVFLYKEPFTQTHGISFGLVWMAITIYAISSFARYRNQVAS
ncbi:MAG: EamA family transporter RarD [Proteobacteria bacterium]|nr:EamA family transporter RarD [Pseudomonadota bacterium]